MLEHVPFCHIIAAADPGLVPHVYAAGGVRSIR
jgi:hypothetical protein